MSRKALILKANQAKFKVRNVNRCWRCGRSRSVIRYFGLCRLCFREKASKGEIPGITKSSW